MANKTAGQINEIGGNVERLAGLEVRAKVMQGSQAIVSSSRPETVALWVKEAMRRLDKLTDDQTRQEIMLTCGYHCILVNPKPLERAMARRQKYPSEAAFLEAEVRNPPRGFRFAREGQVLIQFYTPRSYGAGMRCYCSLLRGLPESETVSPTYCQCSRGFVERYWEGILGRRVEVDLLETAISGAEECKFVIHL